MAPPPNSKSEPSSKSSNRPQGLGYGGPLQFTFLTLFPEIFQQVLTSGLLGKSQAKGLVSFRSIQIRDFATDKHKSVDDVPYGGGEGMVLRADVLFSAWKSAGGEEDGSRTILMSPQGAPLKQEYAKTLATHAGNLIIVCGRYEGIDERFIERCVDEEMSIGDYVLTGGELPALVLADVVTRLLPGTLGNERSLSEESFERGLLKYPQFTRPREFEGVSVPEVLLSGDHQAIAKWRTDRSRERTVQKRPDLLPVKPKN